MESIKTIICNTKIKSAEDFESLATEIINNYCIDCGDKKYRFAEIEFYYYDKNNEHFDKEWNHKTYPRTEKKAGDLFFHYSGVDICFDCSFEKGCFGGILIRSLFDEEKQRYITGPLLCANEILNSCSSIRKWPIIERTTNRACEIDTTTRYGIFDVRLCFFDKRLKEKLVNSFEEASWDYKKQCPKKITRNYSNRFNNGE